jgi:hypothetical protein
MSFQDYLRAEGEIAERLRVEYRTELLAFAELADLYERLVAAVTVAERRAIIPAELLLVVANEMFGSGAQMLRTRAADALALTRRAIEATAIAYRMWQNPELAAVFVNAYPRHNQIGHPEQWLPTREYRKQFSTRRLFDQPGGTFAALKGYYGLTSAMASHAALARWQVTATARSSASRHFWAASHPRLSATGTRSSPLIWRCSKCSCACFAGTRVRR